MGRVSTMMRSILRVLVLSATAALTAVPAHGAAPTSGNSLSGQRADPRPQKAGKPVEEFQGLGVDRQLGVFAGTVLDINDRPVENVFVDLFIDGELAGSTITEGSGIYEIKAPYDSHGDTTVLLAEASMDGMCRPWDYQAFVFVKRRFAGTLSPTLMDSRTDGALSEVRLLSPTSIQVVFLRYVDADPLCCPSRLTTVRYRVEGRGKGPVVVPVSAKSKSTGG